MHLVAWISPRDAGQTVQRRKGRPEAQLVLCQRVSRRWQVGGGQCQGGGYPQRDSHGRLRAYFPKECPEQNELSQIPVVGELGVCQKWLRVFGGTSLVSGATRWAGSQSREPGSCAQASGSRAKPPCLGELARPGQALPGVSSPRALGLSHELS